MFNGIIEKESLNNTAVLKSKEIKIVKKYIERHPEANTNIWHTYLVKIPSNKIKGTIKKISNCTRSEWYSIFWDKSSIFVIFKNKIFQLKREDYYNSPKYKKLKDYAVKHGIQKQYLDFKKEFRKFKSPSP